MAFLVFYFESVFFHEYDDDDDGGDGDDNKTAGKSRKSFVV